jgi:spermidine synthase
MLGLGFGSLAGGRLSKAPNLRLLGIFGAIEIGIGSFGAYSLLLFHHVASLTAGASAFKTGVITMSMLLLPTLLMGSTLPLLVAHVVRVTRSVGESVGVLYSVNTCGSAVACVVAALFTMRWLGESGSVRMAAALNILVGCSALLLQQLTVKGSSDSLIASDSDETATIPVMDFRMALVLVAVAGFISLAYEIVWYRLYSFVSGGTAPCFALMLGSYLGGIAFGSLFVHDLCRQRLRRDSGRALGFVGSLFVWAGIVSFLIGPCLANVVRYLSYIQTFPLVFIGASLLGAVFPLLAHAAVDPTGQAGSKVSYLYIANIIGAASGSFVVGFTLMDRWSLPTISLLLLGAAVISGALLLPHSDGMARRLIVFGSVIALLIALFSPRLFSNLYEKLLYKRDNAPWLTFRHVIETRSGVVTVAQDGTVFGGGVYDGKINTDLIHDTNGIFRAFAITSLHPHPSEVLMIGLSSGSWAQVIANDADVVHLTIVEINPGYLQLISEYPVVASLLHNPKVQIVIDDGRRWLVRYPKREFDLIVMNTTYHWRAHTSNLLSAEFLALARRHLKPGGIHYYNTTGSEDALMTGATVFPYSLRVFNFLAVSDRPILVDRRHWANQLTRYRVEGRPVFDLTDAAQRGRLEVVLSLVDTLNQGDAQVMGLEFGDSLRQRLKGARVITDDNMGTEWNLGMAQ